MNKLFYMGLEPYEGRYTLQLQDWNERVFKKRNLEYVIVPGETLDNSKAIVTGQVLDAHGRSYFAMSQMMSLVKMMREGQVDNDSVIFFEDMFQPGIESLPYIMNQIPNELRPRVYVRCLAQTIDPDDFVHVWGMYDWMSKYEQMVSEFVDGVLCASEEMVAHIKIAGWRTETFVTGLPYGKEEVSLRTGARPYFMRERENRIVFAARWDQEKQPNFYMDLAERWSTEKGLYSEEAEPPELPEFAICCGGPLRSNDPKLLQRAKELEKVGIIKIYDNLKKDEYYDILANSKVLFNCALQDWVSNTVSEADTLGAMTLFPAYRSFPEVFANNAEQMYIPWSLDDATSKLENLLSYDIPPEWVGKVSDYQDKTIDRTVDVLELPKFAKPSSSPYWRGGNRYRNNVSVPKY